MPEPVTTVKLPDIDTGWFSILTLEAVEANDADTALRTKEAVCANDADVANELDTDCNTKLAVLALEALVANEEDMELLAQLAVPNKLPVKLFIVATPVTVRDPVILTEPVNW